LAIFRAGRTVSAKVSLRPRELANTAITRETQQFTWRGLLLGACREGAGVKILEIAADSPLAGEVKVGDVLASVADQPVRCVTDLLDVLATASVEQCRIKLANGEAQVTTARE
jgi:S1-C subfamily serine protease